MTSPGVGRKWGGGGAEVGRKWWEVWSGNGFRRADFFIPAGAAQEFGKTGGVHARYSGRPERECSRYPEPQIRVQYVSKDTEN